MEIEKSNNGQQNIVVLNNERSYLKSISLGIKFAMDHFGDLTKCMWPFFLLTILLPFPGILFFQGTERCFASTLDKIGLSSFRRTQGSSLGTFPTCCPCILLLPYYIGMLYCMLFCSHFANNVW